MNNENIDTTSVNVIRYRYPLNGIYAGRDNGASDIGAHDSAFGNLMRYYVVRCSRHFDNFTSSAHERCCIIAAGILVLVGF